MANISNSFTLKVYDIYNNNYDIYCLGNKHSIEYIKFVMERYVNINRSNMELYLDNEKLKDTKTLDYYKINRNSNIKFFIKMNTGL